MPFMPGSRCSELGCTAMAEPGLRGRCRSHRRVGWYDRPSQHTLHVDEARMKAIKRRMLRSRPLCVMCEERRATDIDHIIPVAGEDRSGLPYPPGWGMGSLYDEGNLQPLCAECHAMKTQAEAEELRAFRASLKPRRRRRRRR